MSCFIREEVDIKVVTFPDTYDEYGQKRTGDYSLRDSKMVIKNYNNTNVSDPRYVQVTDIGLTKDFSITDANQIQFGNATYNVLFTIPTQRYL